MVAHGHRIVRELKEGGYDPPGGLAPMGVVLAVSFEPLTFLGEKPERLRSRG
jgi:hypothetical protein